MVSGLERVLWAINVLDDPDGLLRCLPKLILAKLERVLDVENVADQCDCLAQLVVIAALVDGWDYNFFTVTATELVMISYTCWQAAA